MACANNTSDLVTCTDRNGKIFTTSHKYGKSDQVDNTNLLPEKIYGIQKVLPPIAKSSQPEVTLTASDFDAANINSSSIDFRNPNTVVVFAGLCPDIPMKVSEHGYKVGEIIAQSHYELILGGSGSGCQNEIINGALDNKGMITAVTIPRFQKYLREELKKDAIIADGTHGMSERKSIMKKMATFGFVILPGGWGTFDEFWEVLTEKFNNFNNSESKKIVFVNTDGFYNSVRDQLVSLGAIPDYRRSCQSKPQQLSNDVDVQPAVFSPPRKKYNHADIFFIDNPEELRQIFADHINATNSSN